MRTLKPADGFYKSALRMQHQFEAAHRKKKEESRMAAAERAKLRTKPFNPDKITEPLKRAICLLVYNRGLTILNLRSCGVIATPGYSGQYDHLPNVTQSVFTELIDKEYAYRDGDKLYPLADAYDFIKENPRAVFKINLKPSWRDKLIAKHNFSMIMGAQKNAKP